MLVMGADLWEKFIPQCDPLVHCKEGSLPEKEGLIELNNGHVKAIVIYLIEDEQMGLDWDVSSAPNSFKVKTPGI